jgi:hypothetical protein
MMEAVFMHVLPAHQDTPNAPMRTEHVHLAAQAMWHTAAAVHTT